MKPFLAPILVIICVSSSCVSQIVTLPRCSFERLTWGDSLESVKTLLPNHTSLVRDTVDMEHTRIYSYQDSVDSKQVNITLRFADEGRRLVSIMLFCFGNRNNTQAPDSITMRDVDQLWDWFTMHYGPFSTEKKGNFGQTRIWLFPETTIQMILTHGGSGLLSVIYSHGRW